MSLPRDLTAIVESVARSEYERWQSVLMAASPLAAWTSWADLDPFSQHRWRELALPIVTATIRAIDQGD